MKQLINISGEPREYGEAGVIYEFPFPSEKATKVPDEIAEKLIATGNFKEAGTISTKKKDDDKFNLKFEAKNGSI